MHIRNSVSILTIAALTAALNAQAPAVPTPAQAPPGGTNAPATAATSALTTGATPNAADLLGASLSNARSTLMAVKLDRWKKGSVRDEAEANVNALVHDLDNKVPALIAAADAAPGRLSTAIPLIKHLDALYDVMLRVEEASRVSAPGDQVDALQKALLRVSQARNAYDDMLQTQAAGVEKQMGELETAARAAQQSVKDAQHDVELARAAAKSEPCKPAAAAHKKRSATPATKTPAAQSKPPAQQQPGQKPPAQPQQGQKPQGQPAQKPQGQPAQKPQGQQQPAQKSQGQQQPANKPQ